MLWNFHWCELRTNSGYVWWIHYLRHSSKCQNPVIFEIVILSVYDQCSRSKVCATCNHCLLNDELNFSCWLSILQDLSYKNTQKTFTILTVALSAFFVMRAWKTKVAYSKSLVYVTLGTGISNIRYSSTQRRRKPPLKKTLMLSWGTDYTLVQTILAFWK